MTIKVSFKPKEITKKLINTLSERSKDVIERRYGLGKSVKRETLESVGRSYGITRERVRQIENSALSSIRKSDAYKNCEPVFTELVGVIHDMGAIISENELLKELSKSESVQNHLHFLLVVGDTFTKLRENAKFVHRWHINEEIANMVHDALEKVCKKITVDELLAEREIIDRLLEELGECVHDDHKRDDVVKRWLGLSKHLAQNPFGEWGRVGSPGINMRGIRDMAWLVLRKHGSPMHYGEVADAITEMFNRKAHSATCHNELIKDPRFVLVGRGLYALAEWGYKPGPVKEIIANILKSHGPMEKRDLIDAVKRERYVKTNTIMSNLQDTDLFGIDENGRYFVRDDEK